MKESRTSGVYFPLSFTSIKADEIFNILMGDEVNPRREFIEKNAKFVKNLDI